MAPETPPAATRSEELNYIITTPPRWIIRWGITLLIVLLVAILGIAYAIRFPEVIKTSLTLVAHNSPKPVVAKTAGTLVRLLVRDRERVSANQPLAYLESTANHGEVLALVKELQRIQQGLLAGPHALPGKLRASSGAHLGELQGAYQQFHQAYLAYSASMQDGFFQKKKQFLQKDLHNIRLQKAQVLQQKQLLNKDYTIVRDEYATKKLLVDQKVEAAVELKTMESKLLAKEYPLQQATGALLQNEASALLKEREILEIENQVREERLNYLQSLNTLLSEAEAWCNKYILRAPSGGVTFYSSMIQENQFVPADTEVFYVDPGSATYYGEMSIPQFNLGKVEVGQRILVKLASYPYERFGLLEGKIESLANVPNKDGTFEARAVILPAARTGNASLIRLKHGMTADAEIITADETLLQRLYEPLIQIFR
ncbi:HlyD family efflux transporter periplasmic adaptor subunit [Hymenobacter convexus]|uniref:HlyD family efflux transporter periplasmic adaptor subunit n=1 Tax=Hymenobacter sp. CA1UV-4 TaxID=3063782 RepID=UPI002712F4D9|nr:HlyD family efflux transporter periplasmic adaptor subunit [Hymenobacter sp. CA1UV-4]MDO7851837.1 HlyD family efflux transporter periplasmic adaptor subunit [Hymenobacter sp. CA1UV-4]